MDTGGLAQMTYNNDNNFPSSNGLGVPNSGFASRGKGAHIKRLSVAPPATINSIFEDEIDSQPPRTSRSHLLAGLRTAPKPSSAAPASAPHWQSQHSHRSTSLYSDHGNVHRTHGFPQTAVASHFPAAPHSHLNGAMNQQMYCMPEQVLAPPDLNFGLGNDEQMDPELYNDLMSQNLYLLQRQQQLQQQLMNVTAAAQQFQGMSLHSGQNISTTSNTPGLSVYNQQLQNGLQPIINPVPNQPGVYTVYNPMTGQQSVFYDQSAQTQHHNTLGSSPPSATSYNPTVSVEPEFPNSRRGASMSPQPSLNQGRPSRTITPPKASPSPPQDVKPLPTPSSNAFRPGHRKSLSNALSNIPKSSVAESKTAVPRSAGFPQTPMTGTFGPGLGRVGEHPIRQPRGPPPLEELVASPTSKHEGSKNFATRQRRRAVHNLVRAGNERRSGRGSGDGGTPSSEGDMNFTGSDADSEGSSGMSGNTSVSEQNLTFGLQSPGGEYTGYEWKEFRGRAPVSAFQRESEKRKTPLLVLASAAEKRKTSLF